MKNLKQVIQEKFIISQNTKKFQGIRHTTIQEFQQILEAFQIEHANKFFTSDFNNSVSHDDVYWICVHTGEYIKDKGEFGRTFFSKTAPYTDYLLGPRNDKMKSLLTKKIKNFDRYQCLYNDSIFSKMQFLISIFCKDIRKLNNSTEEETIYENIYYIVSGSKEDLEKVYNMFINDKWKDYLLDIYDLIK